MGGFGSIFNVSVIVIVIVGSLLTLPMHIGCQEIGANCTCAGRADQNFELRPCSSQVNGSLGVANASVVGVRRSWPSAALRGPNRKAAYRKVTSSGISTIHNHNHNNNTGIALNGELLATAALDFKHIDGTRSIEEAILLPAWMKMLVLFVALALFHLFVLTLLWSYYCRHRLRSGMATLTPMPIDSAEVSIMESDSDEYDDNEKRCIMVY